MSAACRDCSATTDKPRGRYCKACKARRRKASRAKYRAENREAINKYQREWYRDKMKDPAFAKKRREEVAKHNEAFRERQKESA